MSNDKTGGPAFPSPGIGLRNDETKYQRDGMTLWDWYAGSVLSGVTSDSDIMLCAIRVAEHDGISNEAAVARMAADLADAMLAERKKRGIA